MLLDVGALVFNVRDFISLISWELQYWNSPHSNTGSIALGISMNDSESSQSNERRFFKISLLFSAWNLNFYLCLHWEVSSGIMASRSHLMSQLFQKGSDIQPLSILGFTGNPSLFVSNAYFRLCHSLLLAFPLKIAREKSNRKTNLYFQIELFKLLIRALFSN